MEVIELPHGRLRRWTPSVAEQLHAAIEASREHLRPFMPWASTDPSDLGFRLNWLAQTHRDFDQASSFAFGIFDVDGQVVGGCGMHPVDEMSVTIGYWVHVSELRRGFAAAAARALTDAAFDAGWTQVLIRHDEANVASRVIAERLGFKLLRSEPHNIDAPGQTGTTLVWGRT